ncbi:hypothetical protein AKJ09_00105 [Labilithrix luteola]|uniref:Tryptophan synthase alpha chain n=1 Tax=Labilithrix luteola TaxID=1391654 RepID=A0A0K1PJ65_9BACT|nr:hypothetical protein [Labilithrix luteola]AKU93441.1 hypothetical protein AKJ09_00105 [Labilithrix luteola]
MRSKLVLGSLFACAILIACSSSNNNSAVLDDTDAGDDTNTPGTKKDSGATTKDAGKDSGKPKPSVPDGGDNGGGTAKVGDSCSSSADCSGAVASACSNEAYNDGTVYASPICLGSCSGDLTECDGPTTICDDYGDTGQGTCFPKCTASATAVTTACSGKNACMLLADDGAGGAVGECTYYCTADSDCTGGDKCEVESGACVKTKTVYPKAPGQACTADTDCGCIFPAGKEGYCSKVCVVGDSKTCPDGLACHVVGIDPTAFNGNPTKAQGQCMKECSTNADCTTVVADQASWKCMALPGGKSACVAAQ